MSRNHHDKRGVERSPGPKALPRKPVVETPAKTPRAGSARGAAAREHARRHIDRLYEVSRLFSNFSSIEATVVEVLELVTQALPLRSVILIEEGEGAPLTTVWHAKGMPAVQITRAEASAREGYAYLVPEGKSHLRELDVTRRPSASLDPRPAGLEAGPQSETAPPSPEGFLLLPLVTDHLPIAGALQIELAGPMDAIDLAFMNGVALQLAVAIDRHQAWKTEVELRGRAEALALQNAHLYEDALAAVNARDDFIGVASHELLSPITALDLQVKILLSRRHEAVHTPEALDHAHALIHRQTARLVTLVHRLLDATRAAAGHLTVDVENDVDLGDLVEDAAERLTLEAAQVGSGISIDVTGRVIGRWDRFRLEQVVTNLLGNAIKYGGGSPIAVRVERRGSKARLSVRDQGLGIDLQDQKRIFERFSRAGDLSQRPGLGLGLYITRQIVEEHGGTIRLESALGSGSAFTIELPLEGPPRAGSP